MSKESLRDLIITPSHRLVEHLNTELLPRLVDAINHKFSIPMMSKPKKELLPTHQRNLTDARTRIGTLLESALALTIQSELDRQSIDKMRVTLITHNTYPDLVIRDAADEPLLRFEVKALELVSEEKSANFDTLVRDLLPARDLLCVLLWEWNSHPDIPTREFPEVKRAVVFDAYWIGIVRDLGWLSSVTRLSKTIDAKAIDIAGPIVGSRAHEHTVFKAEEHNMGKLMRILPDGFEPSLDASSLSTILSYRDFKVHTISDGLRFNAIRLLHEIGADILSEWEFTYSPEATRPIVMGLVPNAQRRILIASTRPRNRAMRIEFLSQIEDLGLDNCSILTFTDKFNWTAFELAGRNLDQIERGEKFSPAVRAIRALVGE